MRTLVALIVTLLLAAPSKAQTPVPNPFAAMDSKSAHSLSLLYLPDVTYVGLNPAALGLTINPKSKRSIVTDPSGVLAGDLTVGWGTIGLTERLSNTSIGRVMYFRLGSDRAVVPSTAPYSVSLSGEAVELTYAHQVSPGLYAGAALVPHDRFEATLHTPAGRAVDHSSAHSTFQGRVGLLYAKDRLKLGLVYASEHDRSHSSSGVSGSFRQSSITGGLTYEVRPGTTLSFNRQVYWLTGQDFDTALPSSTWGASQMIRKRWIATYIKSGKNNYLAATYLGGSIDGYLAVSTRAFSSLEPLYGKSSLVMLGVTYRH